jgi:hypothetical protein
LFKGQVCDCKRVTWFYNKYKKEQTKEKFENTWTIVECKCESAHCRNKHYTRDERERVKKALWTFRPYHPGSTHRPQEDEACVSMALQCACRFKDKCMFSHDPRLFPEDLVPRERQPGKRPARTHQQPNPKVLGKRDREAKPKPKPRRYKKDRKKKENQESGDSDADSIGSRFAHSDAEPADEDEYTNQNMDP